MEVAHHPLHFRMQVIRVAAFTSLEQSRLWWSKGWPAPGDSAPGSFCSSSEHFRTEGGETGEALLV